VEARPGPGVATDGGGWEILKGIPGGYEVEPLATGNTPLEAVEELRRDLETRTLSDYTDELLLTELLQRRRGGD
jgi:hypothetical protein